MTFRMLAVLAMALLVVDSALAQIPPTPSTGQYIIDPTDIRRGPFDLGPNFYFHDWRQSPFHESAQLCGTCHDLSNPTLSKQPDGSYQLNAIDAPHPTQIETEEFPIERTFMGVSWVAWARTGLSARPRRRASRPRPSRPGPPPRRASSTSTGGAPPSASFPR